MTIDITTTSRVLSQGGLVVFPSDTVYGLLVDATSPLAVEKLIRFKNRAPGKAISVFVSDMDMLEETVEVKDASQYKLLSRFLPGPYTIILPSRHIVQKKLESEKGTLGVRIPDYSPVIELVRKFGNPITATSANLGGKSPHYSITSLLNQLPESKKQLIDFIVDAGNLPRHKPSTVMDLSGETIKYLRRGDIVPVDTQTFTSSSPTQSGTIALNLLKKTIQKAEGKPIVLLLQGDLGSGKTVIAKAIGAELGIQKIISPTYVVYYEYPIVAHLSKYNKLIHADLYNIQEENEFDHLGLETSLTQGTIMIIEWGEKLGNRFETLAQKALMLKIHIRQSSETQRLISYKTEKCLSNSVDQ